MGITNFLYERIFKRPVLFKGVVEFEGGKPYKVYSALLTQSGTNPPTAKVLENTLGGTVVWNYNIAGSYYAKLANAFTQNKTVIFMGTPNLGGSSWFMGQWSDESTVYVDTAYDNLLSYGNSQLNDTFVEIRVYP